MNPPKTLKYALCCTLKGNSSQLWQMACIFWFPVDGGISRRISDGFRKFDTLDTKKTNKTRTSQPNKKQTNKKSNKNKTYIYQTPNFLFAYSSDQNCVLSPKMVYFPNFVCTHRKRLLPTLTKCAHTSGNTENRAKVKKIKKFISVRTTM